MVQLHNESSPQPELAYLGPEGTYSHQAAYELCGDSVRYEPRSSIRDLGVSITDPNRTARFAFIPLENSTFGSVVESYDILRHPALGKTAFIRGEQILSVRHCLIALPGTKIEDITSVSSHEQALGQCTEYVRRVLPNATKVPVTSTAFAAKSLLEHADDVVYNRAAISAAICAKLYGLVILEEGIQDGEANQTRFLLFHDSADEPLPLDIRPPLQYRSLLRIQLDDICKPHPAGSLPNPSLSGVLAKIASVPHLTITRIDRRPSLSPQQFHDVVFVEVQGTFSKPSTSAEDIGKEQTWKAALSKCVAGMKELLGVGKGRRGEVTSLGNW